MAASAPTQDPRTGKVRECVAPAVQRSGLFLDDVTLAPAGKRTVVRITIDLPEDEIGALNLDALADVSREISAALDETDPVKGEYTLEVSTPGVSRPLTEARHFRRARTRMVAFKFVDKTTLLARIVGVSDDGETITVETPEGETREIARADVRSAKVEVEFTHYGEASEDEMVDDVADADELEGDED